MPTVQGIFRRGLQLAALREFIIGQGSSKNTNLLVSGPLGPQSRIIRPLWTIQNIPAPLGEAVLVLLWHSMEPGVHCHQPGAIDTEACAQPSTVVG
jgi:hypothetical protein